MSKNQGDSFYKVYGELHGIDWEVVKSNKKIVFDLLYDKNNSLYKKIKIEQARKDTSNN